MLNRLSLLIPESSRSRLLTCGRLQHCARCGTLSTAHERARNQTESVRNCSSISSRLCHEILQSGFSHLPGGSSGVFDSLIKARDLGLACVVCIKRTLRRSRGKPTRSCDRLDCSRLIAFDLQLNLIVQLKSNEIVFVRGALVAFVYTS